jgi:hypothetical protein
MVNLVLKYDKWKKIINTGITPEEREILLNKTGDDPIRIQTAKNIADRNIVDASEEEASFAQQLYDQHKISDSILIDVSISYPDGNGLINCRVGSGINLEHKQIRF